MFIEGARPAGAMKRYVQCPTQGNPRMPMVLRQRPALPSTATARGGQVV